MESQCALEQLRINFMCTCFFKVFTKLHVIAMCPRAMKDYFPLYFQSLPNRQFRILAVGLDLA